MVSWNNAVKIFGDEVFQNYNSFCIFLESVYSEVSDLSDDGSLVSNFARWVNGKDELNLGNTRLEEVLKSKYNSQYRSQYIHNIRQCLDDFKPCFPNSNKSVRWGMPHTLDNNDKTSTFNIIAAYQDLQEALLNV